ncbi:glycosyltransferase [Candidatus Latescibacterota bacterium]
MKGIRVAFIGNLCGNAFFFCRALRERGVDAHLFLSSRELSPLETNANPGQFGVDLGSESWVHVWDVRMQRRIAPPSTRLQERLRYVSSLPRLWQHLRAFDIVHAFTLTAIFVADSGRPFVVYPTGSDLAETAISGGILGYLLRRAYRRAGRILLGTANRSKILGLDRAGVLGNTQMIPMGVEIPDLAEDKLCLPAQSSPEIRYFMPTRQDFADGTGAKRQKGNDRFLKALAVVRDEGLPVRATLLERGEHLGMAKRLIRDLELDANVRWLPSLTRTQLLSEFVRHDVVVDQFAVGNWGTTCIEAMSHGRPVMVHVLPEAATSFSPSGIPVLNVCTQEQIAEMMRRAHSEREWLGRVGLDARRYTVEYHGWDAVCSKVLEAYSEVLDGRPVPRLFDQDDWRRRGPVGQRSATEWEEH